MDLTLLHELAAERSRRWEAAGIEWEVVDGPQTDKPAAWLVLRAGDRSGQLTVWTSGEAEMEWGDLTSGDARHYDLASRPSLEACVTDLDDAIGLGGPATHPAVDELVAELSSIGWISDIWLHGSLATGDHVQGVSDLDVVAITTRPLDTGRVADLERLHHDLDARWPGTDLGCTYVDEAGLLEISARHPTWTHGRLVRRHLSLMVRAELLDHGKALLGRAPDAVLAPMSPGDVRDAVRHELTGYWSWAARRPWLFLDSRHADLALLSMARARVTLATGALVTKTEATVHVRAPTNITNGLRRRREGSRRPSPFAPVLAHHAWHDVRRTITENAQAR